MKIQLYKYLIYLLLLTSCSKFPDLGDGYSLAYNSVNDIGIATDESESGCVWEVYGAIIDYSFDSTFILAIEKPRDSVKGFVNNTNALKKNVAYNKSNFKQYWIINKKTRMKYGPLKFDDYLNKKKELNIPINLKLKTEK